MNSTQLDRILKSLFEKRGTQYLSSTEFMELIGEWEMDELSFLENKGFIKTHKQDKEPYWHVALTAEGKHFIKNGGFEREDYLKNEPINISNKAYQFSKLALIISCLVAILVGGVQLVCNNTQGKEINQNSSNQKSVSSPHVSDTIHKSKIEK